jgi:hypothetical protein
MSKSFCFFLQKEALSCLLWVNLNADGYNSLFLGGICPPNLFYGAE